MSSSETVGIVLNGLLEEWYCASVLGHGNSAEVMAKFHKAKDRHSTLAQEAERRLRSLDGIDINRCFLSQTHRNFLEKVLNEQNQNSSGNYIR